MDTPILNAQVEETCMNAWPALKEVFYDGWLIRLANGATRRTNSVNVIGPGRRPLDDKIAYCENVYRAHAQPTYFRILSTAPPDLDAALLARGYAKEDETRTLYMNFRKHRPPAPASGAAVDILEGRPTREWLAAYQRHSRCTDAEAQGRRDVLDALSVPAFFAEARDDSGEIASVGFRRDPRQADLPAMGRDRPGAAPQGPVARRALRAAPPRPGRRRDRRLSPGGGEQSLCHSSL